MRLVNAVPVAIACGTDAQPVADADPHAAADQRQSPGRLRAGRCNADTYGRGFARQPDRGCRIDRVLHDGDRSKCAHGHGQRHHAGFNHDHHHRFARRQRDGRRARRVSRRRTARADHAANHRRSGRPRLLARAGGAHDPARDRRASGRTSDRDGRRREPRQRSRARHERELQCAGAHSRRAVLRRQRLGARDAEQHRGAAHLARYPDGQRLSRKTHRERHSL